MFYVIKEGDVIFCHDGCFHGYSIMGFLDNCVKTFDTPEAAEEKVKEIKRGQQNPVVVPVPDGYSLDDYCNVVQKGFHRYKVENKEQAKELLFGPKCPPTPFSIQVGETSDSYIADISCLHAFRAGLTIGMGYGE